MIEEQAAFEAWLNHTRPSGDVDAVQYQWSQSSDYQEWLDDQAELSVPSFEQWATKVRQEMIDNAALTTRPRYLIVNPALHKMARRILRRPFSAMQLKGVHGRAYSLKWRRKS